jgi:hypothetical protein
VVGAAAANRHSTAARAKTDGGMAKRGTGMEITCFYGETVETVHRP